MIQFDSTKHAGIYSSIDFNPDKSEVWILVLDREIGNYLLLGYYGHLKGYKIEKTWETCPSLETLKAELGGTL